MDKDTNVKQISWSGEYKKMRRQWALRNNRTELIMLAVLLVGCVVMSMVSSTFLSVGNILNICSQQSTTALMAIGMTLVIITGGIDLSVGTLLGFSGMLAAMRLQGHRKYTSGHIDGIWYCPVYWHYQWFFDWIHEASCIQLLLWEHSRFARA